MMEGEIETVEFGIECELMTPIYRLNFVEQSFFPQHYSVFV